MHTTPALLSEQELLAQKRWPIYFYITVVLYKYAGTSLQAVT
jgi:hypothetical protein